MIELGVCPNGAAGRYSLLKPYISFWGRTGTLGDSRKLAVGRRTVLSDWALGIVFLGETTLRHGHSGGATTVASNGGGKTPGCRSVPGCTEPWSNPSKIGMPAMMPVAGRRVKPGVVNLKNRLVR